MSITERWIIGILLAGMSSAFSLIIGDVRSMQHEHDLQIHVNSSRLSVVETETKNQWREMEALKEDGQRKIDEIREWLGEHRKATERH